MHTPQQTKDRSREYAIQMDNLDELKHLRQEFIIPSKNDLKSKTLSQRAAHSKDGEEPCIYFCGNSLGLQPRRTSERVSSHLNAWAKKGVLGHFTEHEDSTLPPFLHIDDTAARLMAPLVGAKAEEVAVMETLTANLHLLMASFYQPTKERYKIIIEGKAFPSDHYAVESQIRHHGLDPKEALVIIEPQTFDLAIISTAHILSVIEEHATSTALILLPGIQYYTGQYLDIGQITAKAHALGILIGWDLAHAVGNVTLELARWDVDFAAWCNYKYVNSGPGAIGGLFVNSRHGKVDSRAGFRPRLSGWWGGDKSIRFQMGKGKLPQFLRRISVAGAWPFTKGVNVDFAPDFVPIQGAAGFQVGNPSALALTAVIASLEIFALTSMTTIRAKSVALTDFLEELLLHPPLSHVLDEEERPYKFITPQDPAKRGAQLSVLLRPGLLDGVMKTLEDAGVIVDERKPDVIRVAPAPLYNTFEEVWHFANIFTVACLRAQAGLVNDGRGTEGLEGKEAKGWAQIK